MSIINYTRRSLNGLWVGDCIGNLGSLYFVHDILKALESGLAKFGNQLNRFQQQFIYSDDTEEALVLYNHIISNGRKVVGNICQNKLAMEFATRYYTRDPDGEIYGYGLNTRKVLKDIYDGIPWRTANKFLKPKAEGMPSHIDSLVDSLSKGKDLKAAMHEVNLVLERQKAGDTLQRELQGSCGNGAAMRVAPLGAYLGTLEGLTNEEVILSATLQAEVTHCHPEGIAGSIAITTLAAMIVEGEINKTSEYPHKGFGITTFTEETKETIYDLLLDYVPKGQVYDGIVRAKALPFNTPIGEAIKTLGNGTHVTCQDTVPLCCFLTIKHLISTPIERMYEDAIIETSMAFGDVDTNCAIVGGMIAIACPPPEKWVKFCTPMEGVIEE